MNVTGRTSRKSLSGFFFHAQFIFSPKSAVNIIEFSQVEGSDPLHIFSNPSHFDSSRVKMRPGSTRTLDSEGDEDKKCLMTLSITELISILRTAYRSVDYDRVEEVLVAKETKLKDEIGVLNEKLEMERLERMNVEEQLKKCMKECEKVKKAEERYETLLEAVKKRNDLDDGSTITELRIKKCKLGDEKGGAEPEVESRKRKSEGLNEQLLMVEKGAKSSLSGDSHLGIGRNAGELSGIQRNTDTGVSTEVIPEKEINEVVISGHKCANTTVGSSPSHRETEFRNLASGFQKMRNPQARHNSSAPCRHDAMGKAPRQDSLPNLDDMDLHTKSIPIGTTQKRIAPRDIQRRGWYVQLEDASGRMWWHNMFVRDVLLLPEGQRVVVHFNDINQPDGDAGGLLGLFLSSLGRNVNIFPVRYPSWIKIPSNLKNNAYRDVVQTHFVLTNKHRSWCLKKMGTSWRNHRFELYSSVQDGTKTVEQLLEKVPDGINQEDWGAFIRYREDPKMKAIAEINKRNSKKQTTHHTSGSKTLARKRAEMESELGRKVTRAEVWIATHKHKDGTAVTPAVQTIIDMIVEKQSQMESSTASITDEQDALTLALGVPERPGRVRGMGLGPTPTQVFDNAISRISRKGSVQHGHSNDAKMDRLEEQMQEIKATLVQLLKQNVSSFDQPSPSTSTP